eukprot:gene10987-7631_t
MKEEREAEMTKENPRQLGTVSTLPSFSLLSLSTAPNWFLASDFPLADGFTSSQPHAETEQNKYTADDNTHHTGYMKYMSSSPGLPNTSLFTAAYASLLIFFLILFFFFWLHVQVNLIQVGQR